MRRSTLITLIIIIIVIAGAIYIFARHGSNNNSDTSLYNSGTTANQSQPAGSQQNTGGGATGNTSTLTLNTVTDPKLGSILVATNGMTLYKYTKDTPGSSNCTGQCAVNWPPFTVSSASNLAGGLALNGKIGTITRPDGTLQVTYNNQPLYFYIKDTKPGDVTGQNVGGVWFVVKP